MEKALGIDFGTEFCRMAEADVRGGTQLLASPQVQERRTPSVVGFTGAWVWGWVAASSTAHKVWDVKSSLLDDGPDALGLSVQQHNYTMEDLVHQFLRHFRQSLVETARDSAALPAVITVPYSFGIRQREALRRAAENAGFSLVGIINEPEAVLLACHAHRLLAPGDRRIAVVFDVGSRRTGVAIFELTLDTNRLSADLLAYQEGPGLRQAQTAVAVQCGLMTDDDGPPAVTYPDLIYAFTHHASHNKDIVLETAGEAHVLSPQCISDELARWSVEVDHTISSSLSMAHLQPRDVDFVFPAGGGCELDVVRRLVSHFSEIVEPRGGASYEDVCVRGAALYAQMRAKPANAESQFESAETPAIGIELSGGAFHPILDVNHGPEARSFRVYEASDPGRDALMVTPYEGFCRIARANWPLCEEPIEIPLTAAETLMKVDVSGQTATSVALRIQYGGEEYCKDLELI